MRAVRRLVGLGVSSPLSPSPPNGRTIRILGLSRSGNHPIINWILAQLRGRWCFFNCVEPKGDPLYWARPMDDGRSILTAGLDFDHEAERAGRHARKDAVLISCEDAFLGPAFGPIATRVQDAALGSSGRRDDLVILRDPFNLIASRRKAGLAAVSERTALRIWRQHARAALASRAGRAGPAAINYPQWLQDRGYRQAVAEGLGLEFTDAGRHDVPACANGSSFDGRAFHGRAHEMALLDRWRHYADDASFWSLFDDETLELARALFGAAAEGPLAGAVRARSAAR